jgi:hypothetical protein
VLDGYLAGALVRKRQRLSYPIIENDLGTRLSQLLLRSCEHFRGYASMPYTVPVGPTCRKLTETKPVRIKKSPRDVVAASRA